MPSDHTFRNLNRLHAWFAIASLLLLAATIWMIAADHYRPWREYQRAYRDEVAPGVAAELAGDEPAAREPPLGERVLRQPLLDALGRPIAVEQVYLPDLTIDYHYQRVARCDRCTTCHVGIAEGGSSEQEYELRRKLPQPFRAHPRLDLFVGEGSPHPLGEFGCTVCHDGQGSATDFAFASHTPNDAKQAEAWRDAHGWQSNPHWEQPMLAARFAESRCVQCHQEVVEFAADVQGWLSSPASASQEGLNAQTSAGSGRGRGAGGEGSSHSATTSTLPTTLTPDPSPASGRGEPVAPKLLEGYQLVRQYGCFGCHEINGFDAAGRRIGPDVRLESVGADGIPRTEELGRLRKVGPNLREVGARLPFELLVDKIADPRHFLPNGRMPRFFGLDDHLPADERDRAKRLEAAEIYAIALSSTSRQNPFGAEFRPFFPSRRRETRNGSVERGQQLFAQNGCLSCHTRADFPGVSGTLGPDLSRVGLKYQNDLPFARDWLLNWLDNPGWYSNRTRMPIADWRRLAFGQNTDDARPDQDVLAYLLASCGETNADGTPAWSPNRLAEVSDDDLIETANAYGIPTDRRRFFNGFLGDPMVIGTGQAAIRRRGCAGCHDGLEVAPLIGPELSGWDRKHVSQLAFEKVDELLDKQPPEDDTDGFYRQAVREKRREGFAWQKLRAPRSFDYKLAEKKPYKDWLRMGHFGFAPQQREAIVTFLLSLTADPPKEKYVAEPDARQQALIAGRKVLDEFACEQCHTFEMERWTLSSDVAVVRAPPRYKDWPLLNPRFTPQQIAASRASDHQGKVRATIVGMPRVDASGKLVEDEDDDGNPIRFFTLWQPALVNGHVYTVGGADLVTRKSWITAVEPPRGGSLARWMYPRVLADARAAGATAAETEAWGWLPPPLVHEGMKVQPVWLYEFLLQPTVIRPAAVLRMPRFGLSPQEAAALAEYFAAKAGANAPDTTRDAVPFRGFGLGDETTLQRTVFDDRAMKILTDRTTFCAKCHVIGDYRPSGENQTILAPDLTQVGRRLKPEYLRRWLANPKSVLPYTAMPVNFPPTGEPLGQDLFPGTSQQQLDAVVELLVHYDEYAREKMSIRKMMKEKTEKE